jgi:hypothetical protein
MASAALLLFTEVRREFKGSCLDAGDSAGECALDLSLRRRHAELTLRLPSESAELAKKSARSWAARNATDFSSLFVVCFSHQRSFHADFCP